MNKLPLARKSDLVIQGSGNELLIYDLRTDQAFCLNETSAIVWQSCDGENSASEISRNLSGKLNASVSGDLVWLALEQLNKEKLLEEGNEVNKNFSGLSRREIIRKVGFASIIAMPMVSSIVAPEAMSAQSSGALLAPCTMGPNACNPGLICTVTQDAMAGTSPASAGTRCCTSGSTVGPFSPGSTFCSNISCGIAGSLCCSGSVSMIAPNPACPAIRDTCMCN